MKTKLTVAACAIACALTAQADPIIYKQGPVHWATVPAFHDGKEVPARYGSRAMVQTDLYPPRFEKNGCDGIFIFWAGNKLSWISDSAAAYGGNIPRGDQRAVTVERLMQCRKERPAINGL